MNDKLFQFRRECIVLLYEFREIVGFDLPRIKVRMVDFEESGTLGKCWIGKDYIAISTSLMEESKGALRHVVWHELCHAYFSAKHVDSCPLMNAKVNMKRPVTKAQAIKAIKKLAKPFARHPSCLAVA